MSWVNYADSYGADTIVLSDVKKWTYMPLREFWIYYEYDSDMKGIILKRLLEETNWSLEPILRTTDKGTERIIGWKFNAELVLLHNNLTELQDIYEWICNCDSTYGFLLRLGEIATNSVDLTLSSTKQNIGSYYKISQKDINPEITIYINATFSKDLINTSYNLFV